MGEQGKPARRMGPPGSDNWHAMLDGAEVILRDEGHAALTSRRVAEQIGVKQRLIYYYFHTMDDLIVETFRRLSERELERLRAAGQSGRPLRELWSISVQTTDPRLISQFMALANRIEPLAREVIRFIEESRAIQIDALRAAMARSGNEGGISPAALAIVATSVVLTLTREDQLGISCGHAEVGALIDGFIDRVEPG